MLADIVSLARKPIGRQANGARNGIPVMGADTVSFSLNENGMSYGCPWVPRKWRCILLYSSHPKVVY